MLATGTPDNCFSSLFVSAVLNSKSLLLFTMFKKTKCTYWNKSLCSGVMAKSLFSGTWGWLVILEVYCFSLRFQSSGFGGVGAGGEGTLAVTGVLCLSQCSGFNTIIIINNNNNITVNNADSCGLCWIASPRAGFLSLGVSAVFSQQTQEQDLQWDQDLD